MLMIPTERTAWLIFSHLCLCLQPMSTEDRRALALLFRTLIYRLYYALHVDMYCHGGEMPDGTETYNGVFYCDNVAERTTVGRYTQQILYLTGKFI